ncbi:MAG: hypothetical protein B6226_04455 [Candidatus Cloacimonetes bacterium 4572_65]|nr:MAG: hypothetical protein B6226_04455 [Candidatus Cloacimonetes bacterium 4572_65]
MNSTNSSNLNIKRYAEEGNDNFQGWNSADEHLINFIKEEEIEAKNVLIIEDECGFLTLSLEADNYYCVNDSYLSEEAIKSNLKLNNQSAKNVTFLSPYEPFPENIDIILLKLPKNNLYLEFLLDKINYSYKKSIPLLAAGMVKYMNTTIYNLVTSLLGGIMFSLSWKKSKIVTGYSTPSTTISDFSTTLEAKDITLINMPNIFSSKKLDIGTRFFLDNYTTTPDKEINSIIDVGCANGILALFVNKLYSEATLLMSDITYSAIESARKSSLKNGVTAEFNRGNALDNYPEQSADLIVCNPPFHDNHRVSITTACNIFQQAFSVLKTDGELTIVANKHLGYHTHLNKIFGNVEEVASDSKFTLLRCVKRSRVSFKQ